MIYCIVKILPIHSILGLKMRVSMIVEYLVYYFMEDSNSSVLIRTAGFSYEITETIIHTRLRPTRQPKRNKGKLYIWN